MKIIQEQPKPEPAPQPVEEAAPAPKKKPVPVVQTEPTPAPAPKPKKATAQPAAKPKPVQQAAPAPQPAPVAEAAPAGAVMPVAPAWSGAAEVRMSPIAGSEIAIDKVPGAVSAVTREEIQRAGNQSVTQALQAKVPGATVNETLGNPLAADLQYRGFSASALNGTAQGLSVYQNGVRFNEVFGDATNFDLIPQIAISDIIVMSNNPAFGLNALGGSINVIMKDGFNFQGATIDTRFGSFGHKTIAAEAGQQSGRIAAYLAGEYIDEDGWRDNSPANAKRLYTDIGAKGDGAELHLNYTFAKTFLGVVGPTPDELIAERRENVFTFPQSFDNTMHMVNLQGSVALTDTIKLSGNTYYRKFNQRRPDGNVSDAIACNDPGGPKDGLLCFDEDDDVLWGRDAAGNAVTVPIDGAPVGPDTVLGGIDSTAVASYSFGGALQTVIKERMFNRPNQLLVGASIDQGHAKVTSKSELGILDPATLQVTGLGIIIDQRLNTDLQPGDASVFPLNLTADTSYYGLFFSNTLDVTDALAVTVGGRYNIAQINLRQTDDPTSDLNTNNRFERFNPMIGATYKFAKELSVYGGYSESNRAPTPAELGCANPDKPCLLENFLVSDPPLRQVIGRTVEAGLRGELNAGFDGYDKNGIARHSAIGWSLGYFRTALEDDILTAASPIQGRGYFLNAGDTLRQGFEAAVNYQSALWTAYASYAFINATYESNFELASPSAPVGIPCSNFVPQDPQDEAPNCANVQKGDQIPSIPRHRFKAGFDFNITPQWKIGADLIAMSGQYRRGDEGNEDAKLPGYAVVNLNTSYDVNEHVQFYGLIKNLFDTNYTTFGGYFGPDALVNVAGDPAGVGASGTVLTNPRNSTPAAPFAIYGGMKVKF